MRKLMMTILAYGGIAILSAPTFAQSTEQRIATPPQGQETFCYEEGPADCVSTTDRRYSECADLAVERGWRDTGRGRDRFIYECLTGTIGRAPN
jgi:hypothetical protein